MIKRDSTITVNNNTASIDNDIYLYKYDKNIQITFSIVNSKYMYDNDSINNLIANTQASYAQVKFKKDDDTTNTIEIEFDIQATKKGAVILTIGAELADEDTELGDYSIQIRLFDVNKEAVLTLPPVENCIHILAPLFDKLGTTNVVDNAIVNQALTTYAAPLKAIENDGTFAKKTWVAKEKITTAELNRMEDGIGYNNTQVKDLKENQINLVEDDTSMEGISDTDHDTLTTTNKKIIPAINELNSQFKDIAKKVNGSNTADGITIKDTDNNFTATNVEGALSELFQYASNGKGLIATAITGKGVDASNDDTFTQLATKIQQINESSIASDTALGKKMYSFAVISDIHYGRTEYSVPEDTNKMLDCLEGLNIDFVCGCGDLVNDAPDTRIPVFKQLWDSKCSKTLYSCTGNHDAKVTESVWKQNIGHGFRYSFEKSGDAFIFMSVDNDVTATGSFPDLYGESMDWLATKMQEYKGKRIFLFMHYPLYGYSGLRPGQVYGFKSTSTESSTIAGYLSSIENLIIFSGHSHQPFYLEKEDAKYNHLKFYEINAHNSATIGMPSIGLPRNFDLSYITDSNPIEGIVVDVFEKGVAFRGYDFVNNGYMDEYTYYLQVENNNAVNINISVEQIAINESAYADFTVKLNREIEKDMTVYLVTSNNYISLNKSSLTFTPSNWDTPQTVRVTASHQATNYDTLLSNITLSCEGANSKNITVTVNNIDTPPVTYYSITNKLTGCTNSNTSTQVKENTSYSATITPLTNYQMNSVTVSMGGTDITSSAVSGNNISISSVTGNVIITAVATEKPEEFSVSWELGNIQSANGANMDAKTSMRTNYIPVNSAKHYYFTNVYKTADMRDIESPVAVNQVSIYGYKADKTFIGRAVGTNSTGKYFTTCRERTDITDKIFAIGDGVKYVRIRMQEQNFNEMETNFEEFKKAIKFEEE